MHNNMPSEQIVNSLFTIKLAHLQLNNSSSEHDNNNLLIDSWLVWRSVLCTCGSLPLVSEALPISWPVSCCHLSFFLFYSFSAFFHLFWQRLSILQPLACCLSVCWLLCKFLLPSVSATFCQHSLSSCFVFINFFLVFENTS